MLQRQRSDADTPLASALFVFGPAVARAIDYVSWQQLFTPAWRKMFTLRQAKEGAGMTSAGEIDYTTWDWLPKAARELEAYVGRLLEESGIRAHDISARAKSIGSLQRKQQSKRYDDPMQQMTDIVAVRIITYSKTDRERVSDLVRARFVVKDGEDRNPGGEKPERRRGYDCQHIVVTGEQSGVESDWLISGGKLSKYFDEFGGLEIQIRTVAGHAWAEFEHARRYKGAQYASIDAQDQETIDQLFGAASDAQRALDETFVAIDRILARPTVDNSRDIVGIETAATRPGPAPGVALERESLASFLAERFPNDKAASEKGIEFALELLRAYEFETIDAVEDALAAVDSEQVIALMDVSVPVTRVRRLDDELLARFEEGHIDRTGGLGSVSSRARQLEWRFDRLRGKTRYKAYFVEGSDSPGGLASQPLTAVGTVRELTRIVVAAKGAEAVGGLGVISASDDLPKSARAKPVRVGKDETMWVATNLNREASEAVMNDLLTHAPELDIRVRRDGAVIAPAG